MSDPNSDSIWNTHINWELGNHLVKLTYIKGCSIEGGSGNRKSETTGLLPHVAPPQYAQQLLDMGVKTHITSKKRMMPENIQGDMGVNVNTSEYHVLQLLEDDSFEGVNTNVEIILKHYKQSLNH